MSEKREYGIISRGIIKIIAGGALILPMMCGCSSNKARFVFGVITDVHYADKASEGNKDYRREIGRLAESVAFFNGARLMDKESLYSATRKVKFVIQLGDLIDDSENPAKDLDTAVAMYNWIKARKYHLLGNHDFSGLDRNTVMAKLGMKKAYYDFSYRKWRFVVLDTLDIAVDGGWGKDSYNYRMGQKLLNELTILKAPNAMEWNGAVGDEQKKWLVDILEDARKKGQRVVVFGHHPLAPAGDKHNLWNNQEIISILEDYDCVVAYINGHRHRDDYTLSNGIYYVTIQGMIAAQLEKVYAVVWVYNDRLEIQSTGEVPRLSLPFSKRRIHR